MTEQIATASVEVGTDPGTAFRIFTEEIDLWWVRGPINFFDTARAIAMQIEPGVGGRVLEIYRYADSGSGEDVLELGTITTWEPGARFAYRSSVDDTMVDVRFEPIASGTRVSVEQALATGGEKALYFWPNVIGWLSDWSARRHTPAGSPRVPGRLMVALYYEDTGAAAQWLESVFGLDDWQKIGDDDGHPAWLELHVGGSSVLLFTRDRPETERPVDHETWVYVDDLDAHFAHSSANGATIVSEIHQHGFRCYEAADLEGHRWTFLQASPSGR